MKIAILISKLNGGGAERVASNLSQSLSNNHEVYLIVFDGSNVTYPYKGNFVDLKLPPRIGLFGKIGNMIRRIKMVRKIKRDNNIDLTISLLDGPNIVNVLSRVNDKIITSIRIYLSMSENTNYFRKLQVKWTSKISDAVVALSDAVKQDLIENFKVKEEKIRVIYNSVDGELLSKLSIETGVNITNPYIVTMGRLTEQKGHIHLIRAFSKISKKYPDLELYILGEGRLRSQLTDVIEAYDLSEKIKLLGYVTNPHKVISESQFFVFPSLYEGLGNVVLEALACGKTVISTDCKAGPREILEPDFINLDDEISDIQVVEYGILTPTFKRNNSVLESQLSKEENLFADAISLLLDNPNLQCELNNKSFIRASNFSSESIDSDWESLIADLMKKKSSKLYD